MEWQPIETAPKDGTDVLVWDGYDQYVSRWTESSCGYFSKKEWCIGQTMDEYNSMQTVDPIVWMPLPNPPSYQQEG